jgi:hypothetical protein
MAVRRALFGLLAVGVLSSTAVIGAVPAQASGAPLSCPGTVIATRDIYNSYLPGNELRGVIGVVKLYYDSGYNCAQTVAGVSHDRIAVKLEVQNGQTLTGSAGSRDRVATHSVKAAGRCVRFSGSIGGGNKSNTGEAHTGFGWCG